MPSARMKQFDHKHKTTQAHTHMLHTNTYVTKGNGLFVFEYRLCWYPSHQCWSFSWASCSKAHSSRRPYFHPEINKVESHMFMPTSCRHVHLICINIYIYIYIYYVEREMYGCSMCNAKAMLRQSLPMADASKNCLRCSQWNNDLALGWILQPVCCCI